MATSSNDELEILYKMNGASNFKDLISDDDNNAMEQYKMARKIQMESSSNKANVLDGLSIITAFLIAFAYSDMSQLDPENFKSSLLFILYATSLMMAITIGTLILIAVTFIVIKLRRMLQRDTVRPIYWESNTKHLANFRKNYKTASTARAWYFGFDRNGDKMKGQPPYYIISKSVKLFLVMVSSYVTGLFIKSIDVFWNYNEDDNQLYLFIPFIWILISIVSFAILIRWLNVKQCIVDIA